MYSGRFWLNKLLAQTSCHVVIESAWLCNNYVEWLLVITHWSFYVTELIWSLGFWSVSAYIHLQDGHHCLNKQSSNAMETVWNLKRAKNKNVSPNLKEISEKEDLDTVKFRILMLYNHDVIRLQQKPNISSTRFSGLPTLVTEHAWYCGMSNIWF